MIPGKLCIPESHDMREGAPLAIDFTSERIAMQNDCGDME